LILYKWTRDWDIKWLNEKGPYSNLQFRVLQKCAQKIGPDVSKSSALKELSIQMAIQGKIKHALKCANAVIHKEDKYLVIKKIAIELVKRGKIGKALEYIEGVGGLYNHDWRSITLAAVSGELFINGMIDKAGFIIQEALQSARDIIDEYAYEKSKAMIEIVIELNRQGMVEESEKVVEDILKCVPKLNNYFHKDEILKNISLELVKQGKLTDALERVREMPSEGTQRVALIEIIKELVKRGNIEKAQELTGSAHNEYHRSEAYQSISFELVIQGKIKEALESTISISDDFWKNRALNLISVELVKQGNLEEALQVASKITSERASKSRVY
jgi:tetratricopeptide (TPR) repeat protein